jgi:hypothetical protein
VTLAGQRTGAAAGTVGGDGVRTEYAGGTAWGADVTADSDAEWYAVRTADIEALGRDESELLAAVY